VSEPRAGIDWDGVRRRLRASQRALERALSPDAERAAAVYRQRAAELAGRRARAAEAGLLRVLTFSLGGERYALPLADLGGILRLAGCTPVPGGPPELLGVVNVRGTIRSLVDLGRLLGLPGREAAGGGYVLLLRRGGREVALRVDQVDRIGALPAGEPAAPPQAEGGPAAGLVRGLTPDRLALLDAAAVLDHPVWGGAGLKAQPG
jgi:purine-binding chemotaxis protein CheW